MLPPVARLGGFAAELGYPTELPPEDRTRERASGWRKLSIPIHHLESICVFGPSTISPPALDLCWEHGVAVNFLRNLKPEHPLYRTPEARAARGEPDCD